FGPATWSRWIPSTSVPSLASCSSSSPPAMSSPAGTCSKSAPAPPPPPPPSSSPPSRPACRFPSARCRSMAEASLPPTSSMPANNSAAGSSSFRHARPNSTAMSNAPTAPIPRSSMRSPPPIGASPPSTASCAFGSASTTPSALIRPSATAPRSSSLRNSSGVSQRKDPDCNASTGRVHIVASTGGGVYDFPMREYSPSQGRWWTPDPAGLAAVDPSNPQSWNRYAYVNGRPLDATDPLGLAAQQPCLDGGNCNWDPVGCTIDGMDVGCNEAQQQASMLGGGGIAICPQNSCAGQHAANGFGGTAVFPQQPVETLTPTGEATCNSVHYGGASNETDCTVWFSARWTQAILAAGALG